MLATLLEDKFKDQYVLVNDRYLTRKVKRVFISEEEVSVSGDFIDLDEPESSFQLHKIVVESSKSSFSGMPLQVVDPSMIEEMFKAKIWERRRKADLLEEQIQDIVNLDYKEWFYKYR